MAQQYEEELMKRVQELLREAPNRQMTLLEVEKALKKQPDKLHLSKTSHKTITQLFTGDVAIQHLHIWCPAYGAYQSPPKTTDRKVSVCLKDQPPVITDAHFDDNPKILRSRLVVEYEKHLLVRDARDTFVRRFRRIVKDYARDATEDGWLAEDFIVAIDAAKGGHPPILDLVRLAQGDRHDRNPLLDFTTIYLKEHVATRYKDDQHWYGYKPIVEERRILAIVNGPPPPPLPESVASFGNQLETLAREMHERHDPIQKTDLDRSVSATHDAAIRTWMPARAAFDGQMTPLPSWFADDVEDLPPSLLMRAADVVTQAEVTDQLPLFNVGRFQALHAALATGLTVALQMSMAQFMDPSTMYVMTNEEQTLADGTRILNDAGRLEKLEDMMAEIYAGDSYGMSMASLAHLIEGTAVVVKFDDVWTRCRVIEYNDEVVQLLAVDYGTFIANMYYHNLHYMHKDVAAFSPPIALLLRVTDIAPPFDDSTFPMAMHMRAMREYAAHNGLSNDWEWDTNLVVHLQDVKVDRANAYIKGVLLGVDGCSLTNYLVDFPKLVTNATEPICRLLGERNEEPIVEMKESRVLSEGTRTPRAASPVDEPHSTPQ